MKQIINSFLTISIILISLDYTNASCVTGQVVTSKEDCFVSNNKTNYCCYIYSFTINKTEGMCYSVPIENSSTNSYIIYKNSTHLSQCKADESSAKTCETLNPKQGMDCHAYSTQNDSCCFYAYGDIQGCYWYGNKFKGVASQIGITFQCSSDLISFKRLFIVICVLFLIQFLG